MKKNRIQSFKSFVDKKSKILILGTIPGPEALRRQEYYGFPGNHFWKIIFKLFNIQKPLSYKEKKKLLKKHGIALWDVFQSCERDGALDSAIRNHKVNDIHGLLKKYPNIKNIFFNSRTSEKIFQKKFPDFDEIPTQYLPSTSPAHASLSLQKKMKAWSVILKSV